MGIEQFLLERARKTGEKKGIVKGIDLGVQKNKIETVIAAREDGMEISRIARIAKISEEEVMQILKMHDLK
jgi:predicted transposase YdaD